MTQCGRDNKQLFSILLSIVVALLTLLPFLSLAAESKKANHYKHPIVQQIGEIRVGSTHEPEVIDKFGQGYFVQNEGHGGGRYYTNSARSFTLHVLSGDGVIEDVEILAGLHIPESAALTTTLSKKLSDAISVDHGIKLGMKRKELVSILGKPHEQKMNGDNIILEYHISEEEDNRVLLYYDAYYEFKDDKLIRISIHDGC